MANEKPVLNNPVPKDYVPPSSIPYKVADKDDWGSVAKKFKVDVQKLIYFNFRTNNTDEVNWYLRRNVGCKVTGPGGLNWAFSSSANPGKIYIPKALDAKPLEAKKAEAPKGQNELAKLLDDLPEDSEMWEGIHLGLEGFEFGHAAVEIFEGVTEGAAVAEGVEVAVEGTEVVGGTLGVGGAAAVLAPFAGFLALALAMGSPYLAQVNLYKRKAMFWGMGLGVVLGANKNVNVAWMKTNYDEYMPNVIKNVINIPGQENQFGNVKKAFLDGVSRGFKYGRQLNGWETTILYKKLYKGKGWDFKLPSSGSAQYYWDLGAEFRTQFLPGA